MVQLDCFKRLEMSFDILPGGVALVAERISVEGQAGTFTDLSQQFRNYTAKKLSSKLKYAHQF